MFFILNTKNRWCKHIYLGLLIVLFLYSALGIFSCNQNAKIEIYDEFEMIDSNYNEMVRIVVSDQYYRGKKGGKDSFFYMDIHEVTNQQFSEFVATTGYVTRAEKNTASENDLLADAGSFCFVDKSNDSDLRNPSTWWVWDRNANWKNPLGNGNGIDGLENHPVVHVSTEDAKAYAKWAGKRLPTEAEWMLAASAGFNSMNDLSAMSDLSRAHFCNSWTGIFPIQNTLEDGYFFTAPVMTYHANDLGLYDMIGNVWEYCIDSKANSSKGFSVIRGGSFLCSRNYCTVYDAKQSSKIESGSSAQHIGFRCVKDGQ